MTDASPPIVSICIATFKRAPYIAQTLHSIVSQLNAHCEVVIVDGASPDETKEAVAPFLQANIRYIRESVNSGVDRDYDKAVGYAVGTYCWLMTDDDMLQPGTVDKVLSALEEQPDLLVVNAEVRSADLSQRLHTCLMARKGKERYAVGEMDQVFEDAAAYLSFIGGVIIKRSVWAEREREPYYGSLFIHVGVIFQKPANLTVRLLREPLIVIRYGNAMWTHRGFEIWTYLWPALVWSFEHFRVTSRRAVTEKLLDRSLKHLIWHRAIGSYSRVEYEALRHRWPTFCSAWRPRLAATVPGCVANALCGLYFGLRVSEASPMRLYDLARSRHCSMLTRAVVWRIHRAG